VPHRPSATEATSLGKGGRDLMHELLAHTMVAMKAPSAPILNTLRRVVRKASWRASGGPQLSANVVAVLVGIW
jgi:hypothetical protein